MDCLQARLDSFLKPKRLKKSTSKARSSTVSAKWPHPPHFKATPATLAEAGFYFNPSWEDRDSVTCFMCGKELSDWTEEDDPFNIHWLKCPKCSWAIVRCGLRSDVDDDGNFLFPDTTRLPSHKSMQKARLDTFTVYDSWPHDASRNHGASSKKMALGGFVYTPQAPGDDTASCLYCNISLSGWDDGDDPLQEHKKRMKRSGMACPFFAAATTVAPLKPSSRASSVRPSSRSRSRKLGTATESDAPSDSVDETEVAPRIVKSTSRKRKKDVSKLPADPPASKPSSRVTRAANMTCNASDNVPPPSETGRHLDSTDAPIARASGKLKGRPEKIMREVPFTVSEPAGTTTTIVEAITDTPAALGDQQLLPGALRQTGEPEPDFLVEEHRPITPSDSTMLSNVNNFEQLSSRLSPSATISFLPPLTTPQLPSIESLSESEQDLTVEEWLRREITLQHDRMQEDGRKRISIFMQRAAEVRTRIEAL